MIIGFFLLSINENTILQYVIEMLLMITIVNSFLNASVLKVWRASETVF